MVKAFLLISINFCFFFHTTSAQSLSPTDSLKQEILELRLEVEKINLNLTTSQSKFQKGIFIATLGYATTIAGGLMLGRSNDDLGRVLLVTGGVTGSVGTFLMVDAFKHLSGRKSKPKEP